MVSGIDTDRESIHGLARPRKLVELCHQIRHPLPELRRLRLRDAGVSDEAPQLPVSVRRARISEAQVSEFWERMAELVAEFERLPRSGETVYGFAVGVYPTDHPTLPGSRD